MEPLVLLRRVVLGIAGTATSLALMGVAARGDELGVAATASGFIVHGPEETERQYCHVEDGRLWLVLPGGQRFELVTRTDDPAITNRGDGAFHPFDAYQVRAALAGVRFPLGRISAEVFLLPYPRRNGLESAAGPGLVLLSPGVWPLSAERQHAEFTHELGHVVQFALLADSAAALWGRYRALRGIEDLVTYCASAPHADRPHEIFAEDFRALFGDGLATRSGTIENAALALPGGIPDLAPFLLGLGAPAGIHLTAYPNPSRGALTFRRAGGEAAWLDLFDVSGRRIESLPPSPTADGWMWRWDGHEARDHGTVWFARVRGLAEPALRVTRLR